MNPALHRPLWPWPPRLRPCLSPLSRLVGLWLATLLLAGCSTIRPWQNPPSAHPSPAMAAAPSADRSIVAAVTLSGGGTRAAAFGLGVLRELKATSFQWQGRDTTVLDEVSFISGVSGGSVLAAYYAAFGDETFTRFEPEFLQIDLQRRLLRDALTPGSLNRLSSPWFGRSHLLAESLDGLYRGRTLGDLARRPGAPELLVTATDLRYGHAFEFAPDTLARLCTDWREVPLSFAVAASASVPLLLSPMTLHNHAGQCASPPSPVVPEDADFRTQLLAAASASYGNAVQRPNIHLVDGGIADNLGVRALLDRFVAGGSIRASFASAPPGSIRRLVLVVVNAERDPGDSIDRSDKVPTMGQVADALLFGTGARDTHITLAILREDVQRWTREIEGDRGRPGSPFAPDAQMHVVTVGLHDVPDLPLRRGLVQLPTSFALPFDDIQALQEGGRQALRQSAEFESLRRSLAADGEQPAGTDRAAGTP